MNWDAIGAIAELTGAIGVILSLAYLAVQVRQSTRSTQASTIQAIHSEAHAFTRILCTNLSAARVFRSGLTNPAELTEDERIQFGALLTTLFRNYENTHIQTQQLAWIPERWEPWQASMTRFVSAPGFKTFWDASAPTFSAPFRSCIDAIAAAAPPAERWPAV